MKLLGKKRKVLSVAPFDLTCVVFWTDCKYKGLNMMETAGFMNGLVSVIGVYVGIFILIAVSYVMMQNSHRMDNIIREGGRHVITKLMGLLVMAIAIQFMINGVIDIIPNLLAAAL